MLYPNPNMAASVNQQTSTSPRKATILVVDDEADLCELIRYNLAREGYGVVCVDSGERAIEVIGEEAPDLVILDVMLPGLDGLEVCRRLKFTAKTSNLPVIMLTAKSEEVDIVTGLECGADDYLTKPFSLRVLLARVRALLRQNRQMEQTGQNILQFGDLSIDPERHEVRVGETLADLTITEYRILLTLARRPGWVFSRQQIVASARRDNAVVTSRSVDVHVMRLRTKLGLSGDKVETVRGVGYCFRSDIE